MKLDIIFKRLGLPKHSSHIYTVLEKAGTLSASQIVKMASVHRPATYRALDALIHRGLIHKKGTLKRPIYTAAPRSTVSALFTNTAHEVVALEKETNDTVHSIDTVHYLKGVRGITTVFDDVVARSKKGDTFYRYTSERELDEVNAYLSHTYRAQRDAKKLERLVISNKASGNRKRPRLERFVKFLDAQDMQFTHNAIQLIYADRIAFIDLNTKRSIIIENATLSEFQKSIFRTLYKKL